MCVLSSFGCSVAKLMENFESLDALVAPKQEKDQLLFDLSLFKSSDEVRCTGGGGRGGEVRQRRNCCFFFHIRFMSCLA